MPRADCVMHVTVAIPTYNRADRLTYPAQLTPPSIPADRHMGSRRRRQRLDRRNREGVEQFRALPVRSSTSRAEESHTRNAAVDAPGATTSCGPTTTCSSIRDGWSSVAAAREHPGAAFFGGPTEPTSSLRCRRGCSTSCRTLALYGRATRRRQFRVQSRRVAVRGELRSALTSNRAPHDLRSPSWQPDRDWRGNGVPDHPGRRRNGMVVPAAGQTSHFVSDRIEAFGDALARRGPPRWHAHPHDSASRFFERPIWLWKPRFDEVRTGCCAPVLESNCFTSQDARRARGH